MKFIQRLRTVPLYISYFFKVVDQHSLQAPFVYQFYTQLIQGMRTTHSIDDIEVERQFMKNDHTLIKGIDPGAGSMVHDLSKGATISSIASNSVSSRKECIFLMQIANIIKPDICIELGTSLGIATAYLAKSMYPIHIYSIEGNEILASKSIELMQRLNCENTTILNGNIDTELPLLLNRIDHVDFAIIDANHTQQALLRYFHWLSSRMSPEGVILVDDIRWSMDMYCGWEKMVSHKDVHLSLEFLNKGMLFFRKEIRKQHYVLSYL